MADGSDAKVVPLERVRGANPDAAAPVRGSPAEEPRLESRSPQPSQPSQSLNAPQQALAEKLDRALDDIRRLMLADRTKGQY
jgi:hypothetical protein